MNVPVPEELLPADRLGRVHFVGIGGAGLSGIARIMLARGISVSGSDAKESTAVEALRALGARVHVGHRADQVHDVDTVVLGCTHYPLLTGVISYVMGDSVTLVSSAEEVARDVFASLTEADALRAPSVPPAYRFLSSGDPELFETLGRRFLGPEIAKVEEHPWS